MGDLLVYALVSTAAHKAYGAAGVRMSLALVVTSGAVIPSVFPVVVEAIFGNLWLRRRGPERRMVDFLAGSVDAGSPAPGARPVQPTVAVGIDRNGAQRSHARTSLVIITDS